MSTPFVFTSVMLEVDLVSLSVCVCGLDEFVPVGDCECGEVADAATHSAWLF